MAIVDEHPYPFAKPMAQELLRHLALMYRTELDTLRLVEKHGIDTLSVTPGLSTLNLWHEILEKAAVAGATRNIVKEARDSQPNNPRVTFLDALLADRPAPVNAEPPEKATSVFDDSVTTNEALLFFDDLTMPVGKLRSLIGALETMVTCAPAVCLLRVRTVLGEFFGTGFRVGNDLVLTNQHVLVPRGQTAVRVEADFGFDIDSDGAALEVMTLVGDVRTIVVDAADDWGVIQIPGMAPSWPVLDVTSASGPKTGDLAYILQHPSGQRKRLGFVRNMITHVTDREVHYLTDTQPGSSGSPVLDGLGRVIALHHAGGRPVAVLGKAPVSKNEGIRIRRVVEKLVTNGVKI